MLMRASECFWSRLGSAWDQKMPVAGYTHNGYVRLLAQYGAIFAVPFFALLGVAMVRGMKCKDPTMLACTASYMVFIMSTPRYLNFQLMPFVGLVGIAWVLVNGTGRSHPDTMKAT